MMSKGTMVSRRAVLSAAVFLVTAGCTAAAHTGSAADLVWVTGAINLAATQDIATQWNQLHPNEPQVRVEALPRSANEQRQLMALELNAGLNQFDIA
ncbi:MAG TPA: hypothetical protein VGO16_16075, partial [Pseudonocardiaceae bacterium]|nr:hypothetical protein [Pseudonocardiaceae bacterium]